MTTQETEIIRRIFRGDYERGFVIDEVVEKLLDELTVGAGHLLPPGPPLILDMDDARATEGHRGGDDERED